MLVLKRISVILTAISAFMLLLPGLALAYSTADLEGIWTVKFLGSNSRWRVTFDSNGVATSLDHNRYITHRFNGQLRVESDGRVSGGISREQTDDTHRRFFAYDSIRGTFVSSDEMDLTVQVRWAYEGGFWNYENYSSVWTKVEPDPEPNPDPISDFTNTIGMMFRLIPAGSFMMGNVDDDWDEVPVHQVEITQPFLMGVHEVTIGHFLEYMNVTGSSTGVDMDSEDCPVEKSGTGFRLRSDKGLLWEDENQPMMEVSMEGVQAFIGWLNSKEGGESYRLPTEAEWEYACRAGSPGKWCFGDDESLLEDYAWCEPNSGEKSHPVGQKKPNAWGLYDIHGNVKEWCQDWYQPDYYGQSPGQDPQGPSTGWDHVVRGGSWSSTPDFTRSAKRQWFNPKGTGRYIGFRLVRTP